MSKHGPTTMVIVNGEDNIEYAIKKFTRLSNVVLSEHKQATDHYSKPSSIKHQFNQSMARKREIDRSIKNGKILKSSKTK